MEKDSEKKDVIEKEEEQLEVQEQEAQEAAPKKHIAIKDARGIDWDKVPNDNPYMQRPANLPPP